MSKIKLVTLDMDGTLLQDDQEVSTYTKEVINQALDQGVQVVLCTGRPLPMCYDYSVDLALDSYIVTNNGAEIWEVDKELLERHTFPAEKVEALWKLGNDKNLHMWTVATDELFHNSTRPDNFSNHEWLKIGFGRLDELTRNELFRKLQEDPTIEVTNSSPNNIEVNHKGVNKVHAVERLCQLSNITMDEVMAVGDSMNDYKMLEQVGLGVAVANGQQEILNVADVITASNNDHGVGKAIEKYVLK